MTERWVMNKLDRLEDTVVAMKGEVQRLEEAHAAMASRIERIEEDLYTDKVLEPPATPAPDPVCARCKHPQSEHRRSNGTCRAIVPGPDKCSCWEFVPTAEPEPAPLDVVLMTAIRKWGTLMNKVGYLCGQDKPSGYESNLCDEAYDAMESAIRAYGRDGAR